MYESNRVQQVPAAFRDGFSINFVHIRKPCVRFRDSKTKSLLTECLITKGASLSATVLYRSHFLLSFSYQVFHRFRPKTMGYLDGSPRSFLKLENFICHVPNVFLLLLLYVHGRRFL